MLLCDYCKCSSCNTDGIAMSCTAVFCSKVSGAHLGVAADNESTGCRLLASKGGKSIFLVQLSREGQRSLKHPWSSKGLCVGRGHLRTNVYNYRGLNSRQTNTVYSKDFHSEWIKSICGWGWQSSERRAEPVQMVPLLFCSRCYDSDTL